MLDARGREVAGEGVLPCLMAATQIPLEVIERLPKTDLHVHLDGSLRLSTILELAEKQRIELPAKDADGLRREMHLGENCGSLIEYLKAFDVTLRVMQTADALTRIAYELAEDAAKENVRYMEVRYSPMLHTRRGLKLTSVVEAVLEGLRAAQEKYGIESAVIICGIRNVSSESSLEMAELAVAYKGRGVVGFDLAGAEYDHPAKHHRAAFQLVRDNNINVTIHAGEAYGPESIAQAIHVCGAHRIGHGCRLRENGDLLHYVNDHRIALECCPSSNVQTGAIRELASHPLRLYKNLGLRVTVNTDNRLVTDTTVSKELWLCHTQMGLSMRDLKQLILAGFKSAFLPFHVKQQYLRKVSEELRAFPDDVGEPSIPVPAPSQRSERVT
jgi:adenosine deaminase